MDNTRQSPKLPKLPPLSQIKQAVESPFSYNVEHRSSNERAESKGTTYIAGEERRKLYMPSNPRSPRTNSSRRPPPPHIMTSPASPLEHGSSFNVTPTRSNELPLTIPSTSSASAYNTPFMGFSQAEKSFGLNDVSSNQPSQIYRSPFIGDPSVIQVRRSSEISQRKLSSSSSDGSNDFKSPNMPRHTSSSSIFTYNVTMPNVLFDNFKGSSEIQMKALPALPPRNISGPVNAVTNTTAISDTQLLEALPPLETISPISTGKFTWSTSDKSSVVPVDLYYRPPPKMRSEKDRQLSDSITSYYSNSSYAFNKSTEEFTRHESFGSITGNRPLDNVPSITIPTQPFTIDYLDERKLYQCQNISQLSHIYQWLLKVYFEWFNEYVFGKLEFFQMVQLLLEFQLPNSCEQDTIDNNVDRIIDSLVLQSAVRFEVDLQTQNEITIIIAGLNIQGVFTDLLCCYSYSHSTDSSIDTLKCYSYTCWSSKGSECERPEIKISEFINKSVGLWTDYWKLSAEELSEINPREVRRQSFFFDLLVLEERSLNLAYAAVEIYGASFDPNLLPNDPNFKQMAYDIFIPLIELHKDFLLSPILWKLKLKGKFIDGVGKIYLRWANEAKSVYVKYAENMATVHEIINWEKENDTKFAHWLREIDESTPITRSKLYHDVIFFGGFFKSLQNMPVTLQSALKCTDPSMDDYEYLKMAIKEIEQLSRLVDKTHGDAIDKRKIVRLARQLIITSKNGNTINYINIQANRESDEQNGNNTEHLNLKLGESDRRLIKQGILHKKRDLWLESVPIYAFLLDNYFLITEEVLKGSEKKYRLLERPIPIDYLSLETKEDIKYKRHSAITLDEETSNLATPSTPKKPQLAHAATTMSSIPKTLYQSATNYNPNNEEGEDSTYSFKIRNTASNESFTFFSLTTEDRESWVGALVQSFENYIGHKDKQVFQLQCLCDIFSYDELQAPTNLPVEPEGSVISTAMRDFYQNDSGKISEQIKGDITCTISFQYENETFILCGVNHGVYITLLGSLRYWKRILNVSKVTKMEINAKLGLLFVLADRKLCYFNIPSILCSFYDSEHYLPNNQLVGIMIQEKISFFKMAEDFCNSRHLFYERKGEIVIMTPEFDPLTKIFKFFKHYKTYKLPVSSSGLTSLIVSDIAIFKSTFIVCSSKGAILYADSFNDDGMFLPSMINDKSKLKSNHLSFKTTMESKSKKNSSKEKMAEYVRTDIVSKKTKPLACFQISPNNFIICYDEAIIKLNRNGEIPNWKSDILVLDFYCIHASINRGYLILSGDNLLQVYDLNFIENAEWGLNSIIPVQIIKGKKIRITSTEKDDTSIVLAHPNIAGRQMLMGFHPSN